MFVQVIKAKTSDPAAVRAQGERWNAELRPGATGFLGSTFGVADDGTMFVAARFEDEASARASSDRPEQGAWWAEMATLLDGEATFHDSSDVSTLFDGGSDEAGFVQVIEGTVRDRAALDAMETGDMLEQLRAARPDLLGGLRVWLTPTRAVEIAYFTSEEAARAGEQSDEFSEPQQGFDALYDDMTYLDLRDPVLTS